MATSIGGGTSQGTRLPQAAAVAAGAPATDHRVADVASDTVDRHRTLLDVAGVGLLGAGLATGLATTVGPKALRHPVVGAMAVAGAIAGALLLGLGRSGRHDPRPTPPTAAHGGDDPHTGPPVPGHDAGSTASDPGDTVPPGAGPSTTGTTTSGPPRSRYGDVVPPGSPTAAAPGAGAIAPRYTQLVEDIGVDAHDGSDPASFADNHATRGPGWLSADMGFGVRLPDNRVAWFYGDTVIGSANADGTLGHMDGFLRNSIVVQDGSKLTTLATRGADGALHGSLQVGDEPATWRWPGSPVLDGDHVRLVTGSLQKTATGAPGWNFAGAGFELVTLSAKDLDVESVEPLTKRTDISWGAGMAIDGDHEVIAGTKSAGYGQQVYLARVPRPGHGSAADLEVWNGAHWVRDQAAAAPIVDQVGAQLLRTRGGWAMIGQDGVFSPRVVVRTASSLTGPWSAPRVVGEVPHAASGEIFYTPTPHPEFGRDGQLLVSMSVNTSDGRLHPDLDTYRPRFIDVPAAALEPTG